MPTDDLARSCCRDPERDSYGRRGEGNILVVERRGEARHRPPCCRACKARSSELKGAPSFNSKMPQEEVLAVPEHLAGGRDARQAARPAGVDEGTATRLALPAGEHAEDAHDELAASSPRDPRGPARWGGGARGRGAGELRPRRSRG